MFDKEYSQIINFKYEDENHQIGLYLTSSDNKNLQNISDFLNQSELKEFNKISSDKVKSNFITGRYCAKKSFALISKRKNLNEFTIEHGAFGFPIIKNSKNLQISIAHTDNYTIAICFDEKFPMGIDIEIIKQEQIEVINTQLTQSEKDLNKNIPEKILSHQFWTCKEALSKAIKTGFTIPMNFFEISSFEKKVKYSVLYFKHFEQFKAISKVINDDYVVSIALSKTIEINDLLIN